MLKAVSCSGDALRYAGGLRDDEQVVRAAISTDGAAIRYASLAMRDRKELVLQAVSQNWRALRFASAQLRGDLDLVLQALRKNVWAMEYVSPALKANSQAMKVACAINGRVLAYCTPAVQNDSEVFAVPSPGCPRFFGLPGSPTCRTTEAHPLLLCPEVRGNAPPNANAPRTWPNALVFGRGCRDDERS